MKNTSDKLNLSDFEIQMLIVDRNTCQYRIEAIDEILNKIGQSKGLQDSEKTQRPSGPSPAPVQEIAFTALKWDPQEGAKIGAYETASKDGNDPAKWSAAKDILTEAKAAIQNRYRGPSYQFSYWLYDSSFAQEKIYRQKHKS